MLSHQEHDLERVYDELRRLRDAEDSLPDELHETLDALDASVAQLHSINDDLNEKNLELAAQHQKYRELFDFAPDAFLLTNEQGLILEANPAAAELVGAGLHYVVGKPLAIFVAESDKREFLRRLGQLAGSPEANNWDMEIASRQGLYRSVVCRAVSSPARRTHPPLLYWLIHDITDRVQMERKLSELNEGLEKRVQERTAQLAGAHADLRILTSKLVSIQEEERKRISRELHDEAGQGLIALRMNLEALRQDVPPEQTELRARLIEAGELAFRTVERLRILAQDLRPPAIDLVDLDPLLSQLCHQLTNRSNLPIYYSGASVPPLDTATRISLFRFLQEALSNVIRHAHATQAHVSLELENGMVVVDVEDDGVGFDPSSAFSNREHEGIGLLGMKERIELLGGKLQVESSPGKGTRVAATVPSS